jgi:hypothetical protein
MTLSIDTTAVDLVGVAGLLCISLAVALARYRL